MTMEKKEYITPEMEVMGIETVEMIASSMGLYDEQLDATDQMSNGRNNRRGTWGNLWYTEQE